MALKGFPLGSTPASSSTSVLLSNMLSMLTAEKIEHVALRVCYSMNEGDAAWVVSTLMILHHTLYRAETCAAGIQLA